MAYISEARGVSEPATEQVLSSKSLSLWDCFLKAGYDQKWRWGAYTLFCLSNNHLKLQLKEDPIVAYGVSALCQG